MICSRTLYNWVWAGLLPIKAIELPHTLRRKTSKYWNHENKKVFGKSISKRPAAAALRVEEGHWEGDTVVGKRNGREAVILTLLEKKTENYLAFHIRSKTSPAVMEAMQILRDEFGDRPPRFLKPLPWTTAASLPTWQRWRNGALKCSTPTRTPPGSGPKTSVTTVCSGPTSQRARPLRSIVIKMFSLLLMNSTAGLKKLGCRTPEELFESFLDAVFAA